MEFTKEGLELVKTSSFAKTAHDYLSPWREQKASDTEIANLVTSIVAWAATGHDVSKPPVDKQSYELTAFALGHLKEITDLQDVVARNMLNFQLRG
jgi:hypothetical protein